MIERLFQDARYIEYCIASFTICWGGWLLAPWSTFTSSPVWQPASHIAPEWAWGAVIATGGVALGWGISVESYAIRRRALLLLMLLWLAVWAALTLGTWQGTHVVVYIHVVLVCGFAYLRLSKNDVGS